MSKHPAPPKSERDSGKSSKRSPNSAAERRAPQASSKLPGAALTSTEQQAAKARESEATPSGAEGTEHGAPRTPPRRRWGLVLVSMLHFAAFASAAVLLPWEHYAAFGLLTALLAVGHAGTALAAGVQANHLDRVWRVSAWLSLVWLATLTWSVGTSALYLARIYGALGAGIAVALLIGWSIPLLFTIPFASWGLAATPTLAARQTGKLSRRCLKQTGIGGALALLVVLALSWQKLAQASTQTVVTSSTPDGLRQLLHDELPDYASLPAPDKEHAPLSLTAIDCGEPVDAKRATLFLQFRSRGDRATRAHCLQGSTARAVVQAAGRLLRAEASRAPIKLDLVTGVSTLTSGDPLLDGFKLRPGLDGICDDSRCLLGWQLAARHMLNENVPVSSIPELRMGFSAQRVRQALGGAPSPGLDGLHRLEAVSFLVTHRLERLLRMHRAEQPVTSRAIERFDDLAESHVVRAAQPNGRFRYQLDPFNGSIDNQGFNLPRQAGTTLVLCEFGSRTAVQKTGQAALEHMAQLAVTSGEKSVLLDEPGQALAGLGKQALPLIAFLTCRPAIGKRYDKLIGGLGSTLLALQRKSGDFHPHWDLGRYAPHTGDPPLFAPGQAVMALVLLEQLTAREPGRPFPSHDRVREAVDKAMRYYGEHYWDFPLSKLFYVEENWHCLAARAALSHHRVDAYERFCIEHAEFKARFTVGDESPTADMRGAFALAALIPPPNTATAGVGEALAAAIALKRARREDTTWAEATQRRLLEFLLRQQWDSATCFACARPDLTNGGLSDSMLTPTMRIDFTQHAWAAVRHGGHMLGLAPPPKLP